MYDIIYWQQLTFRRALPSVMLPLSLFLSPFLHLSRLASTPKGSFLPTLLRTVALPLPLSFSPPLSIFLSSHSSLSHTSFFHWADGILCFLSPFTSRSRPNFLIPSLFPVVTNKSKLSPAEKNARRFPEQRKAGFLA